MLYPKSNKYRDVYNLNGVWKYKIVDDNYIPGSPICDFDYAAVPASINEITTDGMVKSHVGKFLFEREFSLPVRENTEYRLRIGAPSHQCEVYLNGVLIGKGINGYFPVDLSLDNLQENNRLSVVIDNRLTFATLPVGKIENGKQIINHDFYNFTGIHRDVLVYTRPVKHIDDIEIKTVVGGDYRKVTAIVTGDTMDAVYTVFDGEGKVVSVTRDGNIILEVPKLWSPETPYLYTLCVETATDKYEETFGVRKVEVRGTQFLLNDKPIYFKGFGLHEDFFVLGKGASTAVNLRNFECMKWCNANSFRTSHYPYSEEIMDLADRYGFMVIDEVPAVGMNWWDVNFAEDRVNDTTLQLHKELIKQLYERDKNHPCVVMMCVGNEPGSNEKKGEEYFKEVFDYARTVWNVPLTVVEVCGPEDTLTAKYSDVIFANRYYGWYEDHGDIPAITDHMRWFLSKWWELFQKPVVISEFGADTVEGIHALPAESFSEDYQYECIKANCEAFDEYEHCIGEHVWNLADFKTKQGLTRVRGNRKGVFTKDRQPKLVARYFKERWEKK